MGRGTSPSPNPSPCSALHASPIILRPLLHPSPPPNPRPSLCLCSEPNNSIANGFHFDVVTTGKGLRILVLTYCVTQGWANYGPRAACGPPEYIMRPVGSPASKLILFDYNFRYILKFYS